jgi:predicted DNA-binding transcriptional regulator AlpA
MPTASANSNVERPQLMFRRTEAAAACGKGTSTWDKLTAAGLNPAPIKLGGTVLWSAEELAAWIRHGCPDRSTWKAIWRELVRHAEK